MKTKQLAVRIPEDLHSRVKVKAFQSGLTVTEALERLLRAFVDEKVVIKVEPEKPRRTEPLDEVPVQEPERSSLVDAAPSKRQVTPLPRPGRKKVEGDQTVSPWERLRKNQE